MPKRFLIIRLDEIGDYILTIPLIRELKKNFPDAAVDMIVKHPIVNFVKACPYTDCVQGADLSRRKFYRNSKLVLRLLTQRLKYGRYDAVILPRPAIDCTCSRLLAWFAGGKTIMAYHTSCSGPDKILPDKFLQSEVEHSVRSGLRFITASGWQIYSDELRSEDLIGGVPDPEKWKSLIAWSSQKKYAFCSICSFSKIKNWGKENFCELIDSVYEQTGYTTILLGSADDAVDAEWMVAHTAKNSCYSLCGKTDLRDIPSILQLGNFYYGADTSTAHFSAAAGLPCVVLTPHGKGYSGWLSTENRFHPWQVPYRVVNPEKNMVPCDGECKAMIPHCITTITPAMVLDAIKDLLQKSV